MIARLTSVIIVGLGALAISATSLRAADPRPTDEEVNKAIARGVQFLRDQQESDGNWSYEFNLNHELGITALAGLALLENGVPRDDPAIQKADRVVRRLAERSNQTYDITLAILFLARMEPGSRGPNDDLIRRLARRLEAGQDEGMWTYQVPREEPGSGSRRSGEGPLPRMSHHGQGDNSNTQFALLGIWAAGRHGFDSNPALETLDKHFRETQNPYGGWGYTPHEQSSEAMSCAGLMALAISAARPKQAERQTARARGNALAADPAFTKALGEVSRNARGLGPQSDVYYIWSLERVCVALGLRSLDGFDWYAAGARELLDRQRPDGGWPVSRWGTLPDTCLALLFLRKANLAFELDRVLKLPDPNKKDQPVPKAEPIARAPRGGDDVSVVVRQVEEKAFPKIGVEFEVKNPDDTPLLNASKDDFHVTEYDQDVPILEFASPQSTEARPTTVVLVLDHSLSMEEEDRIGQLKQAVGTFLANMPTGSRVAVIAFGSEVKVVCPFTSDVNQVKAATDALTPEGATRYYDAVAEALELIAREPGRRAILAFTDGEDTFSQTADINSVILSARRAGLPVHTLGLGSEDEIESDALRRLASETRGRYFLARQADQLRGIFEELARGLGSSYHLAYRTARPLPDGTLRPVKVFYRASRKAGQGTVFVRGMVVPATGWSWLFLTLVVGLGGLALLPGWWGRRTS